MEDSSNNKLNIDDKEEDEEEIANTYCPYKKVTNFFGGLFNNPQNTNDERPADSVIMNSASSLISIP